MPPPPDLCSNHSSLLLILKSLRLLLPPPGVSPEILIAHSLTIFRSLHKCHSQRVLTWGPPSGRHQSSTSHLPPTSQLHFSAQHVLTSDHVFVSYLSWVYKLQEGRECVCFDHHLSLVPKIVLVIVNCCITERTNNFKSMAPNGRPFFVNLMPFR